MMMNRTSLNRQRGVVIVVALFIVALVATLSYVMIARLDRDIYRTRLITYNTQADFYAEASVIWAIDQLRNDWIQQKANHLIDPCPIKSPENTVDGYHISSTIEDMQARFNLNNLSTPEAQADFIHLLQIVMPSLRISQAQKIVNAIVDWISSGDGGAKNEFNDYYLKSRVPYRPAKRPMVSLSELKLIKGVTPKLYDALKPYICVLPIATPINVQTADLPVLATLSKTMTPEAAKALLEIRKEKPFVVLNDFMNMDLIKNHAVVAEKVTVVSSYFLVATTVIRENQHAMLYTLLERNARDGSATVRIIWQSK